MNERIKELLFSYVEDDVRLGLILAKEEGISAEEINDIYDDLVDNGHLDKTDLPYTIIFDDYLEQGGSYKDRHLWDYTVWK